MVAQIGPRDGPHLPVVTAWVTLLIGLGGSGARGPGNPMSLLGSGNQANTKNHLDTFWGAKAEAPKLREATALAAVDGEWGRQGTRPGREEPDAKKGGDGCGEPSLTLWCKRSLCVRAGGRLSCSQSPSEELDCKFHEGRAGWLSPLIGSCSDPRASSVRASPLVALHLVGKPASEPVNRP